MLRFRLLFAAVILIPLLGLLVADYYFSGKAPGIWLAPLGLICTVMAASEVLDLLKQQNHRPVAWSVYCGAPLIFLAACAPLAWGLVGQEYPADCPLGKLGWPLSAAAAAVALAFVAEMLRYEQPGGVIVNVALAMFAIFYVGLLMSFVGELRFFGTNEWGMAALVSLVFVTKLSDTGAYTCGKLFGRRKMAPKLSPGKTIAGALGGILTACAASLVFFFFIVPIMIGDSAATSTWWSCLGFGLAVAVAGMIGDLAESLLKRDMGRKDSSSWLPGLGGVLDVLDSVLMAAPVAYFCWASGLVGPGS